MPPPGPVTTLASTGRAAPVVGLDGTALRTLAILTAILGLSMRVLGPICPAMDVELRLINLLLTITNLGALDVDGKFTPAAFGVGGRMRNV